MGLWCPDSTYHKQMPKKNYTCLTEMISLLIK
jgi:hypothetical protein